MSDWLHNLPVPWMALAIFSFVYLAAAVIFAGVHVLAARERLRAFKGVSAGLLSPLGTLFALFVAFTAAQVWDDTGRGTAAIDEEAGALSKVVFLASSFPGQSEGQLHVLIHQYIEEATTSEWPAMARQNATLRITPRPLAKALKLTLSLTPTSRGQEIAQREIIAALESALDARRQRIIISEAHVNLLKWCCLFVPALCVLLIIAMVHSDNRLAAAIAMGTFATGVAVSLLLIGAYDRPFTGQIYVHSDPLLQVMPEVAAMPEMTATQK